MHAFGGEKMENLRCHLGLKFYEINKLCNLFIMGC